MGKVICKNCGFENTSDDIFCKDCGKMIMTSEYSETAVAEKQNEEKPVAEEKTETKPQEQKKDPKEKKNNKKRNIIIAVVSAVVLIIGVVIGVVASGVFAKPDTGVITNEIIIADLNNDKAVTTVKIGKEDVDFKVTSIEVKNSTEDEEKATYTIDLSVIRENDELQVNPVDFTVVYAESFGEYKYKSAQMSDKEAKITLKPLVGVAVEKAEKKVKETYKDAKFDKQDTDLEKGTDKVYFKINNKTNKGTVIAVYKFDDTKGWKFSKLNIDKLGFKPGVSHLENGLYTNTAVKNIMFFGVDAESYAGRSDCMMLVSLDTNTGKIKLTSFMRDTYVQIPGVGGNKLNAAYALGGAELAVDAIENTYGIKIDNYAATNFTTFMNVINSLGGVNVNITADEAGYINWQIGRNGQSSVGYVPTSGGNVTLNGQQALWLCRDRGGNGFSGDDFVRTGRQRKVIKSLISSYSSYSASQVLSTLNNLKGNVTTDLSGDDLAWLAQNSGKLFDFEIEERCAPDHGEWSQGYSPAGAWIISVNDWSTLKSDIQHFIYEDLK